MNTVAIIPARGGSKGIKRKNITMLHGKPLIAYTCEAALQSKYISRLIVSTDDLEIANIAENIGVEVPFIRPSHLSEDHTLMIDVLLHAIKWIEEDNYHVDNVILLQPTSPFRTSKHIDEAITIFNEKIQSTLVSITKVPHQFNPVSVLIKQNDDTLVPFLDQPLITRRQDKPVFFARNGPAILITKPDLLKSGKLYGEPTYGYQMDIISSLDIDDPFDILFAEFIIDSNISK